MNPARVVILGAKGFLAAELRRGLDQAGIFCRPIGSNEIDLTDANSVAKLSAVLQPADALVVTSALTPDKGRDPAMLLRNVAMAASVAASLERAPCTHVVYISSDAVYGSRSSLISEESACETGDLYGAAHIAREKVLADACRRLAIPLVILRPCAIFGPGDTHNSYGPNRFIRTALKDGKIVLFGGGEERRDHIYVWDVAGLVCRCILYRSAGVLNAVTGRARSFREVAELVAASVGSSVVMDSLPRSGPVTHRHYDISALARAFPDFEPLDFTHALVETVAGMRRIAGLA